jgi:nucleoside-triphosphatase
MKDAEERPLRILLEGRPGVGKTTLVRRLAASLADAGISLAGFFTEELREAGRRVGFAVETFDGRRAALAHVDLPGGPSVGRYGVDVAAFERLALPALSKAFDADLVVIDELGTMELASAAFRAAISDLLEQPVPLVATVHVFRHPFTDALKGRPGVEIVRLSERNRDELSLRLATQLAARLPQRRR